jgi:hypothetical protein
MARQLLWSGTGLVLPEMESHVPVKLGKCFDRGAIDGRLETATFFQGGTAVDLSWNSTKKEKS